MTLRLTRAQLERALRSQLTEIVRMLDGVPARVDEQVQRYGTPRTAAELGTLRVARDWTTDELRKALDAYLPQPQPRSRGRR